MSKKQNLFNEDVETLVHENDYVDPNYGPKEEPWSAQVPKIAKSANLEKYPTGYIIEPPSENPSIIYNNRSKSYPYQQINLKEKYTQIPPCGQGDDRKESLKQMGDYYAYQRQQFMGYQCIEQLNISKDVSPFLNMSLNNIGDPFQDGYYTVNAKQAERGVLDFYASIWHAQWPSLPKPQRNAHVNDEGYLESEAYLKYRKSYWGYVLSMGSTEGNLYAVMAARDYLSGYSLVIDEVEKEEILCQPNCKGEANPNKYTPVAFYSEAAHYSLAKAVHAMQLKTFYQIAMEKIQEGESGWECPLGGEWPQSVPNKEDGSVNISDLVKLVRFFAKKGYPPFICFNYGTTFKGAYDNIPEACRQLRPIFEEYGLDEREVEYYDLNNIQKIDKRRGYWIHVDGALGASLMPFVEMAVENGKLNKNDLAPCFDFRNNEVMSIVTSGHKWPSASAPTGVYMTKNEYLITPVATPDYLGSADTTFAGSRNGLSAMILWNLISKLGIEGMVNHAERTMQLCAYAQRKFELLQKKLNESGDGDFDIWFQRAPHGGTSLIFRKPIDQIMYKYSLPIEETKVNLGKTGCFKRTYVHLFIFWDRTEAMIDSLVDALSSRDAFDKDAEVKIPCKEERKSENGLRQSNNKQIQILTRSAYKGFR